MTNRESAIVRASIVSIVGNTALAVFKGVVGLMSHSIAITLDAVNSLTDALSGLISLIGTKLAGKPATRDHPFGFGRVEYISSILVAALILAAGISSFVEAIRAILDPDVPSYGVVTLVIVVIAAVTKGVLGVYLLRVGKKADSGTLVGSGTDAVMDAGVSVATFVAAIVYLVSGKQIEAWLAAGIAVLIIKSGIELLLETTSKLLGRRVSSETVERVEREVKGIDGVRLASNLVLQDYGPNMLVGSVHVTVDGQMTVGEFDGLAREIQGRVYETQGVLLSGVTPYPAAEDDAEVRAVRSKVGRAAWEHEQVLELRGLYVDVKTHTVRFDAIVAYEDWDRDAIRTSVVRACEQACSGWSYDVRVMPDYSD